MLVVSGVLSESLLVRIDPEGVRLAGWKQADVDGGCFVAACLGCAGGRRGTCIDARSSVEMYVNSGGAACFVDLVDGEHPALDAACNNTHID